MNQTQFQGLHEFLCVARALSFTKAAAELGLSRPRVSQIISQLESRLQVKLLERTTRQMQLTEAGAQLYQDASRGALLLEQALERAREQRENLAGVIRINSLGGYFGESLLAPALLAFQRQYPEVTLQLDFASHHVDIITERYDLAIRMGPLSDSALIARPLLTAQAILCASPDYVAKQGLLSHPKELNQHPVIHGSATRWRFEKEGQQAEVQVKGQFVCPNGHVQRQATLAGLGITRLPDYYVAQDLAQGRLVEAIQDWHASPLPVNLIYTQNRYKVQRIERLIEHLLAWDFISTENAMGTTQS